MWYNTERNPRGAKRERRSGGRKQLVRRLRQPDRSFIEGLNLTKHAGIEKI